MVGVLLVRLVEYAKATCERVSRLINPHFWAMRRPGWDGGFFLQDLLYPRDGTSGQDPIAALPRLWRIVID